MWNARGIRERKAEKPGEISTMMVPGTGIVLFAAIAGAWYLSLR